MNSPARFILHSPARIAFLILILLTRLCQSAPLTLVQMVPNSPVDGKQSLSTYQYWKPTISTSYAWSLERALDPNGPWLPVDQGYVSLSGYTPDHVLRVFPMAPPQIPSVVAPGSQAGADTISITLTIEVRSPDGKCYAKWPSLAPGGGMTGAFIADTDLELRQPPQHAVLPFGFGCSFQPATGTTPPVYLCVVVSPPFQDFPAQLPALATEDIPVLEALKASEAALIPQIWPPPGPPREDPVPATFDTRSLYRYRTQSPGTTTMVNGVQDANQNGVPDNFEATLGTNNRLIISEVCYSNTEDLDVIQGGTSYHIEEGWDWVEILNPTANNILTTNYTLTDTTGTPAKYTLPAGITIPKGGTVVIIMSGLSTAARPNLWHAPFKLADRGTTLYLYQSGALKDTLTAPLASAFPTRAHNNVSFGRSMIAPASGSWQTGFFSRPTLGNVNLGWITTGALTEPVIVDNDSTVSPKPPLKGKMFRTGTVSAGMTQAESATIVYTLDGSEPTGTSTIYSEPLRIFGTCVLRARAFLPGKLPSQVVTRTFIHTPDALVSTVNLEPSVAAAYGYTTPPIRGGGYYAEPILNQLESIPSVFVALDEAAGKEGDIPANSYSGGTIPRYHGSFEYYDPAAPSTAYRQENVYLHRSKEVLEPVNDDGKISYDVLFDPAVTLGGTAMLQGPKEANNVTSAIFPGSPVPNFRSLILRNPAYDGFDSPYIAENDPEPAILFSDSFYRKVHKDAGDLVPERRWVHMWLNGKYRGLYDLNETPNRNWVSDHLIAAYPAEAATLQPANIEMRATCGDNSPNGLSVWNSEVRNPCATSKANPTIISYYNTAVLHLDITAYLRCICVWEYCGVATFNCSWRTWRNPRDGKWRHVIIEADRHSFNQWLTSTPSAMNSPELELSPVDYAPHLQPFGYLKRVDKFQQDCDAYLKSTGLFDASTMSSRFSETADAARKQLEAEAMRWGKSYSLHDWSWQEPFGNETLYHGTENYYRHVSSTNQPGEPRSSHQELLYSAEVAGLYIPDP